MNSDDITSFSYVYEGETYAFEKKDETWYYTDDHSLNLNQERIKAMILKVAPLKADQVIENVTDMSQYGHGGSGAYHSVRDCRSQRDH